MSVEDDFVFGLPEHACEGLKASIRQEAHAEERFAEELARKVDAGQMTFHGAEQDLSKLGEGWAQGMTDHCRENCGGGVCALAGYGVEFLDVGTTREFDELTPEEQERYKNYRRKTYINMATQMADGIFLG